MAVAIAIGQNAGTLASENSEDLTGDFFDKALPFNSAWPQVFTARCGFPAKRAPVKQTRAYAERSRTPHSFAAPEPTRSRQPRRSRDRRRRLRAHRAAHQAKPIVGKPEH